MTINRSRLVKRIDVARSQAMAAVHKKLAEALVTFYIPLRGAGNEANLIIGLETDIS